MSEASTNESPVEEQVSERTDRLLAGRGASVSQRGLIPLLQAVQVEFGYLPRESMLAVARFLDLSPAKVYSVATFYNQFRFTPPGRHQVKVCMGTACAIKLGGVILDSWQRRLDIAEGETSVDREYSLERVACVGCCSMAPVTVVGEEVHGEMSPTKVDGILLRHKRTRTIDVPSGSSSHDSSDSVTGEAP
ncbi:MAG: NAD(P)H-dependent oxidoreductase subunit E [bacterium]